MEADTENAHIRQGRRDAPDVAAEDSKRLLEDPAFIRAYDRVRDGLIHEIESFKATGSEDDAEYLLEVCRTLRTLKTVRRALSSTVGLRELVLKQGG